MNVKEVTEVILGLNGGRKFEKTCDQLIEGDWESQVNGIAVTFMATVDVIRRAAAAGCDLIITHEPTYFTGFDRLEWLKDDPVYRAKKALINQNRLSIWRYHDHMHSGLTDLIYAGVLESLGWTGYLDKSLPHPHCYTIPATTLSGLVEFFKRKMNLPVIRVIGDPAIPCTRVGILVGGGSLGLGQEEMPAKLMHEQQLDVMVCGEITEWTLSAYVRDAAGLGFNRAMIVVGHERSEGPGMQGLAERLRPLLKGIPVQYIESGEPFLYL
ncbi:MAG TPA: Nif3-like dinuclear metal center hexameric protein [Dehalococcoidales bacterium]|nr:Nif3-like dinuclear metal center hexameric protein [Dehalococcoidales bacterium]